MVEYDVIILASGKGERLGLGYNKMLYKIHNQRLIDLVLQPFIEDDDCSKIVIVSKDLQQEDFRHYKIVVINGGMSRQESAYLGLQYVCNDYILIHDGARVLVNKECIDRVKRALFEGRDCVVPYIDSKVEDGSYVIDQKSIQTPQGFKFLTITQAYDAARKENNFAAFRDDASIVRHYLHRETYYVKGHKDNFKVTTKGDLERLEKML